MIDEINEFNYLLNQKITENYSKTKHHFVFNRKLKLFFYIINTVLFEYFIENYFFEDNIHKKRKTLLESW